MSKYETKNEVFYCTKVKSNVNIETKLLILKSSGKVIGKRPFEYHCDNHGYCEVTVKNGFNITYDMTKCVHPKLQK